MLLDLEDKCISVRLTRPAEGTFRLILTYPAQPEYRDKVMKALSALLRPPTSSPKKRIARSFQRSKPHE